MTTVVPDWAKNRNLWTIYVVTAALFCLGGLLILWTSDTGAGVGYALLTAAAMNVALALYFFRQSRAAVGRNRGSDSY
jgi:hypothetical protein